MRTTSRLDRQGSRPTNHARPSRRCAAGSESGFTIVELLVSAMITLAVIGVALSSFSSAVALNETATNIADSTQNLRAGTNLLVADLLQAGRNIDTGGIGIPSGTGSSGILRPSPPGKAYVFNNTTATTLSSITTGDRLGPTIDGKATDMITIVMSDPMLKEQGLVKVGGSTGIRMSTDGSSLNVGPETAWLSGNPAEGVAPIKKGDLIYFLNDKGTTLQTVTRVASPNVYFESNADDVFKLNQRGAESGSITQLLSGASSVALRRVFMFTYFVHQEDGGPPRLMRMLNHFPPQALAGVIEDLDITYDLVDGDVNPTDVDSLPFTLNGLTYSANQIRKVNLLVGVRAENKAAADKDYVRHHVSTVVSVRNLAYVDRYR